MYTHYSVILMNILGKNMEDNKLFIYSIIVHFQFKTCFWKLGLIRLFVIDSIVDIIFNKI